MALYILWKWLSLYIYLIPWALLTMWLELFLLRGQVYVHHHLESGGVWDGSGQESTAEMIPCDFQSLGHKRGCGFCLAVSVSRCSLLEPDNHMARKPGYVEKCTWVGSEASPQQPVPTASPVTTQPWKWSLQSQLSLETQQAWLTFWPHLMRAKLEFPTQAIPRIPDS